MLNPKVARFFLAFLPQFIDPARGATAIQTLVLGTVFFAIALVIDLLYVIGAAAAGRWMQRKRCRSWPASRDWRHYIALGVFAGLAGGHARQG